MSAAPETISVLPVALQLSEEQGLPGFPCGPDKQPLTEHGFKEATTNLEQIADWWTRWPAALLAVPTGAASKLIVVDIDPDGAGWYREHAERLGCARVHQTRRGHHLLYRMPAGIEIRNSAGKIAKGVDVRGEGGYIIWWPAHGFAAVGDLEELTEPPTWLLEQLTRSEIVPGTEKKLKKAAQVAATFPTDDTGKVSEGKRNDRLSREAFRLRKQGMEPPQILDMLRTMNRLVCNPPLEDMELQTIARGKERIQPEQPEQMVTRRPPIVWTDLEGRDPPPREWVIPHWVPHRHTTLLAGRGGIGKTLLAQHIATALALGHEYMEPLEARRVLMWAGEDDEAELWRRQVNICSWMQQPLSALSERFHLHSYAGDDITLMAPVFGALTPTLMLAELREQVADYRAEVVILDNVARLYGGNENDRHGVTTFCALVQGACAPAAVILLGHPAKAEGSEYSGSTAWEGAVRARLYLSDRPPEQEPDDEAPIDTRVRYISRRKANYSALDLRKLSLLDGVMVPDAAEPARSAAPSSVFLQDIVRRCVTKLALRGIHGTASTASPNYLPRLAKQYGLLETASEKAFGAAMREMILSEALESIQVGKNSNRTPKMGLCCRE